VSIVSEVNAWFRASARDLPWRAPGYPAWGILVSEVMLQQTQVSRVIPRLAEWLERWPTPSALAAEPPGEAVRAWDRLGYPRRALRLHAAATAIADRHGDTVPDDVDALLALPGIGEYTARAVAAFAYGQRVPVVDTNVRRVLARAIAGQGEAGPPSTRRDLAEMEALLPEDATEARITNAAVMELGAVVCLPRTPRCDVCPIAGHCAWRQAGYPPYLGPRGARQPRFEGSDRQVRGIIMAAVRASDIPISGDEVQALWPDAQQRDRALGGLLADGLVIAADGGIELPRR
jgi:A/G-specific adenine glycosylase